VSEYLLSILDLVFGRALYLRVSLATVYHFTSLYGYDLTGTPCLLTIRRQMQSWDARTHTGG